MDCSPPGSSIHGILQARILEWVAISFSRGSSRPRDRTQVPHIAGRYCNLWATREVPIFFFFLLIELRFLYSDWSEYKSSLLPQAFCNFRQLIQPVWLFISLSVKYSIYKSTWQRVVTQSYFQSLSEIFRNHLKGIKKLLLYAKWKE